MAFTCFDELDNLRQRYVAAEEGKETDGIENLSPSSRWASLFFLLDAAWVRSQAERPSVNYTKVTSKVAWTGITYK